MIKEQSWIRAGWDTLTNECPVFVKEFDADGVTKATLTVTGKGVYAAALNGERVGNSVMAPGYTQYKSRLQYQTYDITDLVKAGENRLEVLLTPGWYAGRIARRHSQWQEEIPWNADLIAEIVLTKADGSEVTLGTDGSWSAGLGPVVYSDIYDGEIYDATRELFGVKPVRVIDEKKDELIAQDGEDVIEQERILPLSMFVTPKGEKVIDFGQNFIGYPEVTVTAKKGDVVALSFAEIMDKDGNFYNDNYRTAKCQYRYVCRDGRQTYKPKATFYGFRYVRVDEFPEGTELSPECFTGIALYSAIRQTGSISCSNPKLNQLFSNVLWGQRSNFLDVPTDCPQRDERLGWTGDAQVFCKTAAFNFDVKKFFTKWLRDMQAYCKQYGYVGFTVPGGPSKIAAAWTDAGILVPWEIYKAYGDKSLLEENIGMMTAVMDMLERESEVPNTWRGGKNLRLFGDWLATDALDKDRDAAFVSTTYSGATNPDVLQAAFFAYDAKIVAEALEALGRDSGRYRRLHEAAKLRFQDDFPEYKTQTECIMALRFGLAKDPEETLKLLIRKIRENGNRMSTGFVGTPHILHALSANGRTDVAYSLLLQEAYPSWLFCVNLGATTMWEHWDGINEEGETWQVRMNSFNHYAYGAVAEWVYEVAAGIKQAKDSAGFESIIVEPHPDKRLDWLGASYDTVHGKVSSKWINTIDGGVRYEISVPTGAEIIIDGKSRIVEKGDYVFYTRK